MLDAANIGKVYFDYHHDRGERTIKQKQIAGIYKSGDKEFYSINEDYPKEYKGYGELLSQSNFERIQADQDFFVQEKARLEKREKEEQQKAEQERIVQAEKENLFGFTDNKTPMQSGKILKTLMKESLYKTDTGVKSMTRKQFIIEKLSQGFTPEPYSYNATKKVTNRYNSYSEYQDYKKSGYRLIQETDKGYANTWEINKTEYEFAVYYQEYSAKAAS